jgi:tetratricopeptide (TPR) repeat protein
VQQARAIRHAIGHARTAGDLALEVELVTMSAPPIIFGSVTVEDGLRYVDEVLAQLGHVPSVRSFALHVTGHLRARLGDFEVARTAIDEWRSRFRELGQTSQYAHAAACVWDVCWLAEDWVHAERALREGFDLLEEMGERTYLSTMAANLGEAVYRQGRLDEAERYCRLSQELGSADDLYNEAAWRALAGKIASTRGRFDEAETLATEAVGIAAKTDWFEASAETWLGLAEVRCVAGKAQAAASAALQAQKRYEQKGNLVGASRAAALAGPSVSAVFGAENQLP